MKLKEIVEKNLAHHPNGSKVRVEKKDLKAAGFKNLPAEANDDCPLPVTVGALREKFGIPTPENVQPLAPGAGLEESVGKKKDTTKTVDAKK